MIKPGETGSWSNRQVIAFEKLASLPDVERKQVIKHFGPSESGLMKLLHVGVILVFTTFWMWLGATNFDDEPYTVALIVMSCGGYLFGIDNVQSVIKAWRKK